jgi:hypothetical protein
MVLLKQIFMMYLRKLLLIFRLSVNKKKNRGKTGFNWFKPNIQELAASFTFSLSSRESPFSTFAVGDNRELRLKKKIELEQ